MDPVREQQKHGSPCRNCRKHTFRRNGLCWECDPDAPRKPKRWSTGPDPERMPEDYLMACAEELARRHRARRELLREVGVFVEAT
jgi:hypothetical protein